MTVLQNIKMRKRQRARVARLSVLSAFLAVGYFVGLTSAHADITNSAVAKGNSAGNPIQSAPSIANVPVTAHAPALSIVKTANPDTNVAAGQLVTYTYKVTNTGNVTVQNISLNDVHNGSGAPPTPGNETLFTDNGALGDTTDVTPADGVWSVLAPGDVISFTSTYTITQQDVDTRQ
jgi:uncharacterized repeat protein (TIGR01451 family)